MASCTRPSEKHAWERESVGSGSSLFSSAFASLPRSSWTVCGSTYSCRATKDGQSYWSTAPLGEEDVPSRACKVDVLAALAYANDGCSVQGVERSAPRACKESHPILATPSGETVRIQEARSMPSVLDASWTCSRAPVSERTHVPERAERLGVDGDVTLLYLREREANEEDEMPRETFIADATAAPETPAETVPPPSLSQPLSQPLPSSYAETTKPSSSSSSSFVRCTLPSQSYQRACTADADCLLGPTQKKDLLWSTARSLGVDVQGGLPRFVQSLKAKVSDDLVWSEDKVRALGCTGSCSEARLKSVLGTLLQGDEAFRASVDTLLEEDADFAAARQQALAGLCAADGKCAARPRDSEVNRVRPSTRLHDGSSSSSTSTTLSKGPDGTVFYTRDGVTREAHAERCTDANARECTFATPLPSLTLDATSSLATTYRVQFGDDEYLVMNSVSARDPSECRAALCAHNAGEACPAPLCRREGEGKCVPK